MPTSSQKVSPHKRATEKKQIGEGCANDPKNLKKLNNIRPTSQQINRAKPEESRSLYRKTKSNGDFGRSLSQKSNKSPQKSNRSQIDDKKNESPVRLIRNQKEQDNSSLKEPQKTNQTASSNCRSLIPVRCSHQNLEMIQVEQEVLLCRQTNLGNDSMPLSQTQIEQKSNRKDPKSKTELSASLNRNQPSRGNSKPSGKARPLSANSNRRQSKSSDKIEAAVRPLSESSTRKQENPLSQRSNGKVRFSNRGQTEQRIVLHEKPWGAPIKPASKKSYRIKVKKETPLSQEKKLNSITETSVSRVQVEQKFTLPQIESSEKPVKQETRLCRRPISPSFQKPLQTPIKFSTPKMTRIRIEQVKTETPRRLAPSSRKQKMELLQQKASQSEQLDDNNGNRTQVDREIISNYKIQNATTPLLKNQESIHSQLEQTNLPCRSSSCQKSEQIQIELDDNYKTEIPNKLLPQNLEQETQLSGKSIEKAETSSVTSSQRSGLIHIEQEIILTDKPNCKTDSVLHIEQEIQLSNQSINQSGSEASTLKLNRIQIDREIQLPIRPSFQEPIPKSTFQCNKCDISKPIKSPIELETNPYMQQNQIRPSSQQCSRTQPREEILSKIPSAIDFECREDRINKKSVEARNSLNAYTTLIKEFEVMMEDRNNSIASFSGYSTESTIPSSKTLVAQKSFPKISRCNDECKKKDQETETQKISGMYMGDIKAIKEEKQNQIRPCIGTSIQCYNVSNMNHLGEQKIIESKTKKSCNDETCSTSKATQLPDYQSSLPSISNNITQIMKELGKNLEQQKTSLSKIDNFENEPYENSSRQNRKKSYFSECTKLDSGIRKHSKNYRNIKRTFNRLAYQQPLAASLLRMSRETNCRKLIEITDLSQFSEHLNDCGCVVCRCSPSSVNSSANATTEDVLGDCECLVCRNSESYSKLKMESKDTKEMNTQTPTITKIEKEKLERKKALTELHDNQFFNNLPPELITTNSGIDANFDYMLPQRLCGFEYRYGRPVGSTTSFNKRDVCDLLCSSAGFKNENYGKKRTSKGQSDQFCKLNPKKKIRTNGSLDKESQLSSGSLYLRRARQDARLLDVSTANKDGGLLRFDYIFNTVKEIITLGRAIIHTLMRYN